MSAENLASRRDQLKAVDLSDALDFTFRPVKAAPENYVSQADMVLADISIYEAGMNAEKEGFDAVCIDTMSDSGVAALRSHLSIPVVGPGRVAVLEAMALGQRFSIVTMWQRWCHLYDKTVADSVMRTPASVRLIDVAPDNQALLGGKEDEIFPLLEKAARLAIDEDRADVIILGSMTMHQAHGWLSTRLDVPVINPGPLTYKKVEMLLGLGLSHSRAAYPASPVPRDAMIRSMLDAASDHDH